jgi:RimJ/RimL family protein N-acetyltransferase
VYARLADGTLLLVRPIRPDDKGLLAEGIAHLSEKTLTRRFLSPKTRLSRAELRYLTEVDGHDHVAYVALTAASPRHLVAVGRWVRSRERPRVAEVAFVVGDSWQGRGVGSLLADALADEARFRGIRCFTATMQADNLPAHRLMQKLTTGSGAAATGPSTS